jgi:type VI secretion system protein ImpJ
LPRYDHDDLGGCFYRIRQYIDGLLDEIDIPDIIQRPFEGVGLRMQVSIEPAWLESSWQMYVGIESPLPTEQCVRMWTRAYFDMKIGSSQNVDALFTAGKQGLRFTYVQHPPRALPTRQGLLYFQLSRDSEEWQNARSSLSIAIRLRREAIIGTIEGQRVLNMKTPEGQTTTMKFTLYVIKEEK